MQHLDFPELAFPTFEAGAPPPPPAPRDPVALALAGLCRRAGVEGCALVAASTGTVHAVSGRARSGGAWEAAADCWSLYDRQRRHVAPWGRPRAAVFLHAAGTIGVLPCCADRSLVVVVSAETDGIDWEECERLTQALGAALRSLLDRPLVQSATP